MRAAASKASQRCNACVCCFSSAALKAAGEWQPAGQLWCRAAGLPNHVNSSMWCSHSVLWALHPFRQHCAVAGCTRAQERRHMLRQRSCIQLDEGSLQCPPSAQHCVHNTPKCLCRVFSPPGHHLSRHTAMLLTHAQQSDTERRKPSTNMQMCKPKRPSPVCYIGMAAARSSEERRQGRQAARAACWQPCTAPGPSQLLYCWAQAVCSTMLP